MKSEDISKRNELMFRLSGAVEDMSNEQLQTMLEIAHVINENNYFDDVEEK